MECRGHDIPHEGVKIDRHVIDRIFQKKGVKMKKARPVQHVISLFYLFNMFIIDLPIYFIGQALINHIYFGLV